MVGCCVWILRIIFDAQGLESLKAIHRLERIDRIYAVSFSHDCRFVAVGGFDGKCTIVPMNFIWNEGENASDDDSLKMRVQDSVIELDRPGMTRADTLVLSPLPLVTYTVIPT
jgi:hypothetical protein